MAIVQAMASKGVTVNVVSPSYIGTDMVNAIRPGVLEKNRRNGAPQVFGETQRNSFHRGLVGQRRRRLCHGC